MKFPRIKIGNNTAKKPKATKVYGVILVNYDGQDFPQNMRTHGDNGPEVFDTFLAAVESACEYQQRNPKGYYKAIEVEEGE